MKVLVIDNRDSFTYNLVQMLRESGAEYYVEFCENINPDVASEYNRILISPGPGIPSEKLKNIILNVSSTSSVLGVCLGQQAIAEVFGGSLKRSKRIYHGEAVETIKTQKEYELFSGVPERFSAGRYHSWVVEKKSLPKELEITAVDPEGEIMGIRHKKLKIHGVQFHPESILTPCGSKIISNWLRI